MKCSQNHLSLYLACGAKLSSNIAWTKIRYDNFAREPVAAASLAQVHFANLRETGEPVAVKVQYPNMQNMFRGDIKTIEIMMKLIGWVCIVLGSRAKACSQRGTP
jgi:predicted unusual protein kinase regulating ubiquinone biosynthesis (AarF/ABC1/UbiB family)